jgi:hypothetical protein
LASLDFLLDGQLSYAPQVRLLEGVVGFLLYNDFGGVVALSRKGEVLAKAQFSSKRLLDLGSRDGWLGGRKCGRRVERRIQAQ